MPKILTIRHDGKLVVSGFGTLVLGETPLSSVVAHALELGEVEYKEYEAEVEVFIRFKPTTPDVQWREDEQC